jgi:quercetin dioxygenase-like cupin family protein
MSTIITKGESIDRMESQLLCNPDALIGHETDGLFSLTHHFTPGVYARQLTVLKGYAAVGHRHKHEHLNVVLTGKALVVVEGGEPQIVEAPAVFKSEAGKRKAVVALEDFTIMNIHATEETDLKLIEEQTVEKSKDFDAMQQLVEEAKQIAGGILWRG